MLSEEDYRPTAASAEEIASAIGTFFVGDDARRAELRRDYPALFEEPFYSVLTESAAQMAEAQREARDVCWMVDGIDSNLGDAGAGIGLQPAEREALAGGAAAAARMFSATLAELFRSMQATAEARVPSAALTSSSGKAPVTWHQTPSVVLEILSFLPALDIFMQAENVCATWRDWLFDPQLSDFFWLGVTQREFPQYLSSLLATEGSELLQSGWRTTAMVCVTEREEEQERSREDVVAETSNED